ncbi:Ig-like domain-containing protein [Pseudokineococcus lusitanus]|uniref:Ig-like protein group 4 n=1 Tax=Pseudokineococcus lusitanus TaxID=763993 RepID=A0A3N1HKW9_9ACTN|nr:Ig-like domain-containing protein [Pseudokineococcus lusitanus]ROP43178.1 Ig-like protein group 4 [Pseudokineococcus lusitanus]
MSGTPPRPSGRRRSVAVAGALAATLAGTLLAAVPATASGAAAPARPNSGIGYPVFTGDAEPVPPLPAGPVVGGQMRATFEADRAAGAGTSPDADFWVDDLLARTGTAGAFGDSNSWLFTRGRAAYMYTHSPGDLGFVGRPAYVDDLGGDALLRVEVLVDGRAVALTEETAARKQTPSYWTSTHVGGGVRVVQTKFMTDANVAVVLLEMSSTDGTARTVTVRGASPLAGVVEGDEVVGALSAPRDLTELRPRLSGDGFAASDGAVTREVAVPATGSAAAKVQLGLVTDEIAASRTDYDAVRAEDGPAAYTRHVTDYNAWWADQVPYLDTPEDNIDKTLFYRWWLMRFNFLDADVPGNDYQFPTSMEGVLGYNNNIVLTTGMFIDDLKYFKDPVYSYGPWVSAGEVARSHRLVDNPGDPANWSNSYTQYVTEAAWRSYQLHGGPAVVAENLARYGDDDVAGLLEDYDTNDNGLIEYDWGAMTGNDADAVSFDWGARNGGARMDRTENAYLYSNALAAAEGYEVAGRTEDAERMRAVAERVKRAVVDTLWDADDDMLKHRQSVGPERLVEWKEINNYYPFSVGLMPKPGDADYDDDYTEALRLWEDSEEYPIFPFYTANQRDALERGDEGSNNFSVINSTVTFRMLSSVLRDYPTEYLGAEDYKKLLYWNAWAHYIGGDNRLPDQNEFWAQGSANTSWGDEQGIGYRSWIHHTILGATNFTVIEDAMGFRPRSDAKVEVDPVDVDWPHFRVDGIPYRGGELAVVWDAPGDGERPYGEDVPEGYSVYLDGELGFTLDGLGQAVWDPATGEVEAADGLAVTSATTADLLAPQDVRFADDDRVVDVMAKAGADVRTATTDVAPVTEGRPAEATHTASDAWSSAAAAVDGSTVNEPFWGTAGTSSGSDALTVELDGEQTVDEARVHFYRTSTSDAPQGGRTAGTRPGYAAPESYRLEYRTGGGWQPVPQPSATPSAPRANLNVLRFAPVTTTALRLVVDHHPGSATGVKELAVRSTGEPVPVSQNASPVVRARVDGPSAGGTVPLRGEVRDDGLPGAGLTSTWSAVEAPAGATVIFRDPASPSTTARVTAAGRYVLRLEATDGALTSAEDVVVEVAETDVAGLEVSRQATPTASYTAGWNRVQAVNDGQAPTSGGDQQLVWGTWSGDRPAQQWLQYTWERPVRVASSELVFWSDSPQGTGDGVAVPAAWTVQAQVDGAWVDVASGRGAETGSAGFDVVTTSALRVVLDAAPGTAGGYSAVAVSEWRVRADAPTAVEELDVRTAVGELPELPAEVDVVYADGTRLRSAVVWSAVTADQVSGEGSFDVVGAVDGTALPATATVWVRATPPGQVNTVDPVAVTTVAGTAPSLPGRVAVQYNDGSREMLDVAWDAVDPAAYAAPGTFEVRGAVEAAGTTTAVARVQVLAPGEEPDPDPDPDPEPEPEPGTDVSVLAALRTASGAPDADGSDHDVVVALVEGVLERRPGSPVAVLDDPEAALTAFLPDDAAMGAVYDDVLGGRVPRSEAVLAQRLLRVWGAGRVERLLLGHVVPDERLTAARLGAAASDGLVLTTAAGTELAVEVVDGALVLSTGRRSATVVAAYADVNGDQRQVGHGVDADLRPQR